MFAAYTIAKKNICLRECTKIVSLSQTNDCTITLISHGKEGHGNSMLSLASLGIKKNDEVVLKLEAKDELKEALVFNDLKNLFEL
jgi:phosphotransferase system HPr (HPr) family protein